MTAAECVMWRERERERPRQNIGTEDGFVVRELWHPTDRQTDRQTVRPIPTGEKGRQSHSHNIGAEEDKKHAVAVSRRGAAGERLAERGRGDRPGGRAGEWHCSNNAAHPTAERTASKYFGQHYLTLEKSLP